MCHYHYQRHPCGHDSERLLINCAAYKPFNDDSLRHCGYIDFGGGSTNKPCDYKDCRYKILGGEWWCCQCRKGINSSLFCQQRATLKGLGPHGRPEVCAHRVCGRCREGQKGAKRRTVLDLVMGTRRDEFGDAIKP